MSVPVLKLAPTAVILVASGACAWPYLGSFPPHPAAPAGATAAAASPEIPAALLRPAPAPRPERDPFQDQEQLRAEVRAALGKKLRALIDDKFGGPKGGNRGPGRVAGRAVPAPAPREVDPREGLVLNATSVHGARGVAVVNGRPHRPGDTVGPARGGEPCVLEEVRAREVVLLHKGRRLTLGFRAAAGPAGPAGATAVTATEGGVAATAAEAPTPRPQARRTVARRRAAARN